MSDYIIKVEKVSKTFNIYKKNIQRIKGIFFGKKAPEVKHAVKDVSFNVKKGERIIVIGLTEAGCSALVRMIAGVTYPTRGKITVNGDINAMLSVKAGFENELTCRENIYLKANVLGIPKHEILSHEDEIIDFAGIRKFLDVPLKRAPKGSSLKMCLGVHLLKKSDILIIDDNFNSGGAAISRECEMKLQEYLNRNENVTLIISTSKIGMSKRICTRGIMMDKGNAVMDSDAIEVCEAFKKKREKNVFKSGE